MMEQQTKTPKEWAEIIVELLEFTYKSILEAKQSGLSNFSLDVPEYDEMFKNTFLATQYQPLLIDELRRALQFDFIVYYPDRSMSIMKFDWSEEAVKYKNLITNGRI